MTSGWSALLQRAYVFALLAFLFIPIALVVLFSFEASGLGSFPISGFSLRWYSQLLHDDAMLHAARNTLMVAVAAGAGATVLGTAAAIGLWRFRLRVSPLLAGLIVLPALIPALLVGIALLSFLAWLKIPLSLATVALAHILITVPFVTLTVLTRLGQFDRAVEEAAESLGATPFQRLLRITLPILRPTLVGAALLVAAISVDEFVVTFFTIGPNPTLPIMIWGQMRAGVSPVVNVVSTLMLLVTLGAMLAARRLVKVRFQ